MYSGTHVSMPDSLKFTTSVNDSDQIYLGFWLSGYSRVELQFTDRTVYNDVLWEEFSDDPVGNGWTDTPVADGNGWDDDPI